MARCVGLDPVYLAVKIDGWTALPCFGGRLVCVSLPGGLETGVRGGCIELLIPEIDCGRNDSFEMVRPAIR